MLQPALNLVERDPQMTAVAIRLVETVYPRAEGLLMETEEVEQYWNADGPAPHLPEMRLLC